MTSRTFESITRRTALLGATSSAAILGSAKIVNAQTPAASPLVRPDIGSPAGAAMLAVYATAVGKMKDPAINKVPRPESWTFQSFIHGVPKNPNDPVNSPGLFHGSAALTARINLIYGNPAANTPQATWKKAAQAVWGTCPHGSPWFVAWHRWYLLYFEKFIRSVSGRNDFVLPYWNYASNQGASLRLPALFQNTASPLFESVRGAGFANPQGSGPQTTPMNSNGYLPYPQTDYGPAIQATNLFQSDGPSNPLPFSQLGHSGRVEEQPHDNVHVNIGGLMSNVPVAAGDPIFFVHHCQIDRLWASWQAKAGSTFNWGTIPNQPSKTTWGSRSFTFADVNGALVNVTAAGELNTKDLGYVYDAVATVAAGPVVASAGAPTAAGAPAAAMMAARAPASGITLAAMQGGSISVGSGGGKATLAPVPAPRGTATGALTSPSEPTTLVLMNVKLLKRPPAPLHVFLNLPAGTAPDLTSPYHVGVLGLFKFDTETGGRMVDTGAAQGHAMAGSSEVHYDVKAVIERLKTDGLWKDGPVTVTITTLGADSSTGNTYATVGGVSLRP